MQAPPEIQAMFGTPGEPVPTVDAKDIRAVRKLTQRTAARHPETCVAIGIELIARVCSPGADVKAVWWRGTRVQMLNMLLRNLLSGWVGRPLREIAFLIFDNFLIVSLQFPAYRLAVPSSQNRMVKQ
jgi:hypothetical protein